MAFAAQIDTSILPAFDAPWELATPWKYQGMLFRFFTDLLEDPVEPGPALALVTDPRGPLTRTPAPPVPDPFPAGGRLDDWEEREELYRLPETVVELLPLSPRQRRTRRCIPTIGMTAPPQIVSRARAEHQQREAPFACVQDDVRLCGVMFNRDPFWADVLGRPMDRALATPDAWAVLLGLRPRRNRGVTWAIR